MLSCGSSAESGEVPQRYPPASHSGQVVSQVLLRLSVEFTDTPGNASDVTNPTWTPADLLFLTKIAQKL